MTTEDKSYITSVFNIINVKLDGVHERLDKINGSISKCEEDINIIKEDRAVLKVKTELKHNDYDKLIPKVRILEDNVLSDKSIKKFMFLIFSSGIALGGLIIAIINLT